MEKKKCKIGLVWQVHQPDQEITVQKHLPVSDGRLRVKWQPVFWQDGMEVLGSGEKPSLERIHIRKVVTLVQLHNGVLGHAAARRLDKSDYRLDEEGLRYEADLSRVKEPFLSDSARLEDLVSKTMSFVQVSEGPLESVAKGVFSVSFSFSCIVCLRPSRLASSFS